MTFCVFPNANIYHIDELDIGRVFGFGGYPGVVAHDISEKWPQNFLKEDNQKHMKIERG